MLRPELFVSGEALADFCRQHHIDHLGVFGSVLREDFRPESDVDFLVEYEPGYVPSWLGAGDEADLSALVGRKVDLVDRGGLKPHLRERILASERVIYERRPDGTETIVPLALENGLGAPMQKDETVYLADMLDHAKKVKQYVAGKTRSDLSDDELLRLAILHLVQIIGEAASKVSRSTRDSIPQLDWPKIIGMRNVIVHGYRQIVEERLWETATQDMDPLIAALRPLVPDEPAT